MNEHDIGTSARLQFVKARPPSKLAHTAADVSVRTGLETARRSVISEESSDPGTDAAAAARTAGTEIMQTDQQSKQQQKRAIKREYAHAGSDGNPGKAAERSALTRRAVRRRKRRVQRTAGGRRRGLLAVGVIFALVLVFSSAVSSCSVLFESFASTVNASR